MKRIIEFFSDGKYLSWTRLISTPVVLAGIYCFIWSIMMKYSDGAFSSIAVITLGLGTKTVQTKFETDQLKINNKEEGV